MPDAIAVHRDRPGLARDSREHPPRCTPHPREPPPNRRARTDHLAPDWPDNVPPIATNARTKCAALRSNHEHWLDTPASGLVRVGGSEVRHLEDGDGH